MSLFTSSQFASAAASGNDWRECAKAVLEKLDGVKTGDDDFNFGFLYITDKLADDAESILNLFKSVLNIEHWVGCITLGVCANGEDFIDEPAISAMVGRFDDDSFCVFPATGADTDEARAVIGPWMEKHDPMLIAVHGDPLSEEEPAQSLEAVNAFTQGFMIGGLSSSRGTHLQFADTIQEGGVSGVLFSQDIKVASVLSQGCNPIGKPHVITRGDEHMVLELDGEKAVSVFEQDLRSLAIKAVDRDPDEIILDTAVLDDPEKIPDEFQSLLKGEVHTAFPISESDQKDYLVRNIMGLDPEEGSIAVSHYVSSGERMMFVHRDEDTVREDLSRSLLELRKRVERDTGRFEPKGALYVSCVARGFSLPEGNSRSEEMSLIQEIIGDVPLTGFYAGGEVLNARLYGYTGILTLFL